MKANELRINNLLLKDNNIEKVAVINCDNTIRIFSKTEKENGLTYGCYPLSFFNPITLTEEWLLKFGYKDAIGIGYKNNIITITFTNNQFIEIDLNTKIVSLGGCDSCTEWQVFEIKNIEFVHQWQNIYFALTNNELEIL